ncbi:MAG: bifunctional metallophosphatase/5'-nucleotidase, partial [Candidatus Thorarchaeota archaeon]
MKRQWISFAIALAILGSALSPLIVTSITSQASTIDITIAYTHDLHSHLYSEWTGSECSGGMPLLSAKIQELRAMRPTLLFDCGDTVSGAPVNDINNGIPMIEVMNEIGYDAMAMDNHEYDPGIGALKDMITTADFEILGANVDWPGSPEPLDYSIESIAGYDIGVIGLSPQFWYAPDEVTISDLAPAANATIVALQDLGIDFIIVLGCLSSSLASSVSGIDVLMKAGSLGYIGDTLVVPSVGSYASQVGVLDLTIDTSDGTIDSYSFSAESLYSPLVPDENVVTLIDTWNAPLAPTLDLAVGYFDSYNGIGDLGLLFADAILQQTGADVGTYNHGGIRESIDEGFVTYRNIYRVEPFFNFVATIDVQGSDVESIIGSNYYSTSISSFEPTTWYTVASSNFTVTYFENSYTSTARQDYLSVTVVDAFADYMSSEYPIALQDLLEVTDECRSSITALPDSYLTGGTPIDLRAQINAELLNARNALVENNETQAINHLVNSIDYINSHVSV